MAKSMQPLTYASCAVPAAYVCSRCEAHGVKLWRQYNTFVVSLELTCSKCADPDFVLTPKGTDQITDKRGTGTLVPAVPTEDGESFWGYTAVPGAACAWWRTLPDFVGDAAKPFYVTDEEKAADQALSDAKQRSLDDRAQYRRDTVFLVEASHSEQHHLWADFSTESDRPISRDCTVRWQQLTGELATVGTYTKRPVCVSVSWVRINGFVVMFYEPTSELVDWRLVKKWLAEEYAHVPKWDGSRAPQCDAANFGHCLSHLRDRQKARK